MKRRKNQNFTAFYHALYNIKICRVHLSDYSCSFINLTLLQHLWYSLPFQPYLSLCYLKSFPGHFTLPGCQQHFTGKQHPPFFSVQNRHCTDCHSKKLAILVHLFLFKTQHLINTVDGLCNLPSCSWPSAAGLVLIWRVAHKSRWVGVV